VTTSQRIAPPQAEKNPSHLRVGPPSGKKARLASGLEGHRNTVYCDRCWRERYLLRAISMPVAAREEISWEDLRKPLKTVWRETTRASNWMTTELYARDIRREPGMDKLPPMARLDLYPGSPL
jgi:hypothetical protein